MSHVSLKKDNASNHSEAQPPAKGQKEALPGLKILLVEREGRGEEGGREEGFSLRVLEQANETHLSPFLHS